ncbi:response regulator [bacterium]|nr:response regulator [bacterium]
MTEEKRHILVVEDSETMRNFIIFSLSRIDDVEIEPAINGVDALRKIEKQFFHLIITDINMPIMDGLKLVSYIRKKTEYNEVPIIIITTKGTNEDRERGLRLGANTYITKPIKTFELTKTVSEYLKQNKYPGVLEQT